MPLAAEVQTWVDEMLKVPGVTPEALKPFLTLAEQNEAFGTALKGSVTATADYHRHIQAANQLKKEQEAELAKTQKWAVDLADWKGKQDAATKEAVKRAEEAEARLQATRDRITKLKESGDVDATMLDDLEPKAAPAAAPPRDEHGRYLARDDYEKDVKAISSTQPRIAARLQKLQMEHQKLYSGIADKEFDPEFLVESALSTGRKIDDVWAEKYGVADRRQQLATEKYEKDVEDRAQARFQKLVSENALTGGTRAVTMPQDQSPLLTRMAKERPADSSNPGITAAMQQGGYSRVERAIARRAERLAAGQEA